jgi:hypothetical protein
MMWLGPARRGGFSIRAIADTAFRVLFGWLAALLRDDDQQ